MKKIILPLLICFSLFCVSTVKAQRWKLDPAHSSILFNAKHSGISFVNGRFTSFEATVEGGTAEDFSNAKVSFTAQVSSINTGVEGRDNHLKSADFFDMENFFDDRFWNRGLMDERFWNGRKGEPALNIKEKDDDIKGGRKKTGGNIISLNHLLKSKRQKIYTIETPDKLLEQINKILPFTKKAKDERGEVFTPMTLVNEMLDILSTEGGGGRNDIYS